MRRFGLLWALVAVLVFLTPGVGIDDAGAQQPDLSRAIAAQERHTPDLLTRPGIVGTGVGINAAGVPVVRVYVTTPAVIPPQALDNIPVERVVTGRIDAQCYQTECTRPVPLGVSVGHPNITAGTIGARVKDGSGNVYILSNNHVLANSNNASIGDSALQPGPADGGTDPGDSIGTLHDYKPINFGGGDNTIDAAIAVTTTAQTGNTTFGGGISGYTPTSTTVEGTVGVAVKKEGRTTGLTTGTIAETNVTVVVCYQARGPFMCARSATFINQITIGPGNFSAGGDSGSLIVTQDGNHPVGLLFAGSSTRTIANRIQNVLSEFKVTIDDSSGGTEPPPPENTPPTVTITSPSNGASFDSGTSITFTGSATDTEDGNLTANLVWTSSEDGEIGLGGSFSTAALTDGNHTITASVIDSGGLVGDASIKITVSATSPPPPDDEFTLTATPYKVRGVKHADLSWSGATSTNVDIYRDNTKIATVGSGAGGSGTHTDNIGSRGGGSHMYRVCEAGTTTCSNEVVVSF